MESCKCHSLLTKVTQNNMSDTNRTITRRDFAKASAALAAGAGTAVLSTKGCSPNDGDKDTVKLGVSSYAMDAYRKILDDLDFTSQTGIKVKVIMRPIASNELLIQMISAIQAGTSPYDVLDFEDAVAISFSRAGWLLPMDDIVGPEVWADYTQPLIDMTKIWDQYKGETFRIHHNFEICYWWYRKDWFDAKGIAVPKTWDDVKSMGRVFTNKSKGIWATEEGMQKNSYLDVYIAWITRQAGGNLYEADDSLGVALEYIHDLMYKYEVLNPACLQKNYDQQNNNYIADRVAFMRQWPFFFDVARQHGSWYLPEKVTCHLPPAGPGGKSVSSYAAGWGYGIPKTAPNVNAAKELVKFLIAPENVVKMVSYSTWFLNARHSVLKAAGDKGLAKYLKMYTDASVIATRPFHHKYTEAVAVLENITSAFLTHQISLEEALKVAKQRMSAL